MTEPAPAISMRTDVWVRINGRRIRKRFEGPATSVDLLPFATTVGAVASVMDEQGRVVRSGMWPVVDEVATYLTYGDEA